MLLPQSGGTGEIMRPHPLLSSLLLIAISAFTCLGQDGGPSMSDSGYEISGIVRDAASSQTLNGIRVDLTSSGIPMQFTFTENSGQFTFSGVQSGQYRIQVNAEGYEPFDQAVNVSRSSVYGFNADLKKIAGAPASTAGAVTVHQLGVPAKAQKEFNKAFDLMRTKSDYRGAIVEFDRAIQDFPDYYEAYAMEGAAYLALSDATSAEKVLRKSIELSASKYPTALFLLAGTLNSTNRFAEAEGPARQCVAIDELSSDGHFELGRALLGLGKLDEALQNALRARELEPNNPRTFLLLANIHGARQEYAAFLKDLDGYLALVPSGPMADEIRKKRDQAQQALRDAQPAPPQAQPAQTPQ
ncbi:MAG: carboxypeptidase regulatory-like domain-containing protein [Candidatus Acidiferrales bacterium]